LVNNLVLDLSPLSASGYVTINFRREMIVHVQMRELAWLCMRYKTPCSWHS
jgi:hypothetical protein